MKKYTLPYFGELDLSKDDYYFEADASINESNFTIDIDFEDEEPSEEALDRIKQFLLQLPSYLNKVKGYIDQEFSKSSGFVSDYISFFKEAIEENGDLDEYIDENNSDKSVEEQLLNQLYLLRIGIYSNGGVFAVLDYTIDDEYTDDLLVVYLTDKGELDGMTIES